MTIRKYGAGEVTGVEPTGAAEKIDKTAAPDWSELDEQGLREESGGDAWDSESRST